MFTDFRQKPSILISSILLLTITLVLDLIGCGDDDEWTNPSHVPTYFSGPRPRNIAHRGGAGLFPENTIFAFEQALELGTQILETDVRGTGDNVLVLLHDEDLSRTTDGRGRVKKRSLKYIKGLDAGYWFSPDGGQTYPYRDLGITVPTLEEVFIRFPYGRFNIEIKQETPPIVEKVLDNYYTILFHLTRFKYLPIVSCLS